MGACPIGIAIGRDGAGDVEQVLHGETQAGQASAAEGRLFQARPGDEGADGIVKGYHLLYSCLSLVPYARRHLMSPLGASAPETRIYWQIVN